MKTNGYSSSLITFQESNNASWKNRRLRYARLLQTARKILAAICLPVLAFALVIPKLSAQTILPVSQGRSISAFSSSSSGSTNASALAADFGVFNSQITLANSSASQNSVIDTATITASGSAHGTFTPPTTGTSASDFSVTFNLASSCLFTLSGSMLTIYDLSYPTPESIDLSSTSGTVFHQTGFDSTYYNQSPTTFSTNGVLPSGQYTLALHATGEGDHFGTESYNFAFTVTPVPEPTTSVLLVLGCAALLGLRRLRPSSRR
jgi:hypothetical protein